MLCCKYPRWHPGSDEAIWFNLTGRNFIFYIGMVGVPLPFLVLKCTPKGNLCVKFEQERRSGLFGIFLKGLIYSCNTLLVRKTDGLRLISYFPVPNL